MKKKVFIRQNGSIPGRRIIGELERRGAINRINLIGDEIDAFYYINSHDIIDVVSDLCKDCIELLYNKETDTFYEKTDCSDCVNVKGCINCQDGNLKEVNGLQCGEYAIPEGCAAMIEDGNIIIRKNNWTIRDAKPGDIISCPDCGAYTMIVIFKEWEDKSLTNFFAYAGTDITGRLQITSGQWLIGSNAKLATKEEKDYLFKKIDEAGYVWDAEKLELKKKNSTRGLSPCANDNIKNKTIMKTKEEIDATFKDAPYFAYKEGLQEGYNEALHSLRNQAAIEAMGSFMRGIMGDRLLLEQHARACQKEGFTNLPEIVADRAVGYADALIKELQKEK